MYAFNTLVIFTSMIVQCLRGGRYNLNVSYSYELPQISQ